MSRRVGGPIFEFLRLTPVARRLTGRKPVAAGAAQRWLFFRLAKRYTPLIATEEADGARFIMRTSDAVAGELLFVHRGSDDREVLNRAFRLLATMPSTGRSLEASVLLEVGANIGTTTVAALRSGHVKRVIAIEAHPETASLLRQNLIANGVTENTTVLHAAVTDHVGEVELALSDVDSGDHRVWQERISGAAPLDGRTTVSVPATTLDWLVESGEVILDELALVWMDVQGHEARILQGAQLLLSSDVPIVLEYWPSGLRDSGSLELLEEITQAHYAGFVDLRADATLDARRPISELPALRSSYPDGSFTDLLLLKH